MSTWASKVGKIIAPTLKTAQKSMILPTFGFRYSCSYLSPVGWVAQGLKGRTPELWDLFKEPRASVLVHERSI